MGLNKSLEDLVLEAFLAMKVKNPRLEDLLQKINEDYHLSLSEMELMEVIIKKRIAVLYCGQILSSSQATLFKQKEFGKRLLI